MKTASEEDRRGNERDGRQDHTGGKASETHRVGRPQGNGADHGERDHQGVGLHLAEQGQFDRREHGPDPLSGWELS